MTTTRPEYHTQRPRGPATAESEASGPAEDVALAIPRPAFGI